MMSIHLFQIEILYQMKIHLGGNKLSLGIKWSRRCALVAIGLNSYMYPLIKKKLYCLEIKTDLLAKMQEIYNEQGINI